jgi:toxin ParE1/3/4
MAKVIRADPAIQDLDAIADYNALDKPAAAHQLVQRVLSAVGMLRTYPHMGSLPTELRGLPYRQLIVPPCRIFYRIDKKVVYIVHILRGEQLVRRELFPSQPRVSESPSKQGPTGQSSAAVTNVGEPAGGSPPRYSGRPGTRKGCRQRKQTPPDGGSPSHAQSRLHRRVQPLNQRGFNIADT